VDTLSIRNQDRLWARDHAHQWRDIWLSTYKDYLGRLPSIRSVRRAAERQDHSYSPHRTLCKHVDALGFLLLDNQIVLIVEPP
jgi:hypothetical protein